MSSLKEYFGETLGAHAEAVAAIFPLLVPTTQIQKDRARACADESYNPVTNPKSWWACYRNTLNGLRKFEAGQ